MPKLKLTKRAFEAPVAKESTIAKYNGNTVYDWPAIKNDYISGYEKEPGVIYYPNTKELAERYPEVPYGQIRNRASKEKWEDYKQKSMREAAVKKHKEQLKRLNQQAIAFDKAAAEDALFAQELIRKQINALASVQEYDQIRLLSVIERAMEGEEVDRKEFQSYISPSALESLAKAYALFNEVGRKALGIKDDEPAVNQQVNIVTQTNTTVTQELQKVDPARLESLRRILTNQNIVLPKSQHDIIDAQVIDGQLEVTDGSEKEETDVEEEADES